jgi:hypothetical protein
VGVSSFSHKKTSIHQIAAARALALGGDDSIMADKK